MFRLDHPAAVFVVFALFVAGLIVYPFVKTERFRVAPSKVIALLIAAGICIHHGTFAFLLALLWPLSFIWFPEYWGAYAGLIRGPYIDEKSPPMLISLTGWFFLTVFLYLLWIVRG